MSKEIDKSKLEFMAAMAMQGLIIGGEIRNKGALKHSTYFIDMARESVIAAKALMSELEKDYNK